LRSEDDARELLRDPRPFGIWKLSLAKCGGISPALRLAALARREGIPIAWSSADEGVVGIAAALHTAYATSATRWLDFDASLAPHGDPARGGFSLADGVLRTLPAGGLGVGLA
jgi:L-alanine-DL-glutamate epimerase-like enolase superfamily enzyme